MRQSWPHTASPCFISHLECSLYLASVRTFSGLLSQQNAAIEAALYVYPSWSGFVDVPHATRKPAPKSRLVTRQVQDAATRYFFGAVPGALPALISSPKVSPLGDFSSFCLLHHRLDAGHQFLFVRLQGLEVLFGQPAFDQRLTESVADLLLLLVNVAEIAFQSLHASRNLRVLGLGIKDLSCRAAEPTPTGRTNLPRTCLRAAIQTFS